MDAPSKVTDLKFAVYAQEQVFWLDVSVDNVFGVEVTEGVGHLGYVLSIVVSGNERAMGRGTYTTASLVCELALPGELFVQFALARKLEHEEDSFCVVEIPI